MNSSSLPLMSWNESLAPTLNALPSTKNASRPSASWMVKSSPQETNFCFIT